MADPRESAENPTGVGPGVTGASGDLIEHTGGSAGIGGTGEDDDQAASGKRPDERQAPGPQQLDNARPERSTRDREPSTSD